MSDRQRKTIAIHPIPLLVDLLDCDDDRRFYEVMIPYFVMFILLYYAVGHTIRPRNKGKFLPCLGDCYKGCLIGREARDTKAPSCLFECRYGNGASWGLCWW